MKQCGRSSLDRAERLAHEIEIVAAEIGHQTRELVVIVLGEQRADARQMAEVVLQALAPAGAALERQRRVEVVRAVVDPLP